MDHFFVVHKTSYLVQCRLNDTCAWESSCAFPKKRDAVKAMNAMSERYRSLCFRLVKVRTAMQVIPTARSKKSNTRKQS